VDLPSGDRLGTDFHRFVVVVITAGDSLAQLLSQADSGRLALLRTPVDLSAMLNDRLADARMLDLEVAIAAGVQDGLRLQADEQLLAQVLNNVLGNAIRYTLVGGRIRVQARSTAAGVEVLFSNMSQRLSQVIARAHGGDLTLGLSQETGIVLRLALLSL
jgi:signal transduction histidine kinase